MSKKNITVTLIKYIILAVFTILMIFPLIWLIRSSFMSNTEIFYLPIKWIPEKLRYENYIEALTLRPFAVYLKNSVILVVINVIGVILSCSFAAFGFSRIDFKGRKLWFSLMISTMMIPSSVLLIPQFIEWKTVGAYNTYWPLTVGSFAAPAFYVFLIRQFFMGIPKEYDEAAFIDGASYLDIYSKIILPLSKPALTAVGIFTFTSVWNDFFGPLIYLKDDIKYTAALGLQSFLGYYTGEWNRLMAASTVLVIPMLIVFFITQNAFINGITFSGIKG